MQEMMEIEKFPTVCILENYIGAGDWEGGIKYYEGEIKSLPSLSNWVEKYALREEKEKEERVIDKKATDALNRS